MSEWYYLIIMSSFLLGVASIVEKKTLKREHALAYSSITTIFIAVLALVFLPLSNFNISILDWIVLFAVGITSSVSYWLTARAYKHANISVSAPIMSTAPQALTVIVAYIILGETLSYIQYIGIALLLTATFFLLFGSSPATAKYSKRYPYLMAAIVVLMAAGAIMLKYILYSVSIYTALFLIEMFVALNLFVISRHYHGNRNEIKRNIRRFWKPTLLIAVLTIAYRVTYYAAVSQAPISIVSPMRNIVNVIMVVMLSGAVFNEKGIKRKMALSAVIIVAAYLIVV